MQMLGRLARTSFPRLRPSKAQIALAMDERCKVTLGVGGSAKQGRRLCFDAWPGPGSVNVYPPDPADPLIQNCNILIMSYLHGKREYCQYRSPSHPRSRRIVSDFAQTPSALSRVHISNGVRAYNSVFSAPSPFVFRRCAELVYNSNLAVRGSGIYI